MRKFAIYCTSADCSDLTIQYRHKWRSHIKICIAACLSGTCRQTAQGFQDGQSTDEPHAMQKCCEGLSPHGLQQDDSSLCLKRRLCEGKTSCRLLRRSSSCCAREAACDVIEDSSAVDQPCGLPQPALQECIRPPQHLALLLRTGMTISRIWHYKGQWARRAAQSMRDGADLALELTDACHAALELTSEGICTSCGCKAYRNACYTAYIVVLSMTLTFGSA